MSEPPLLSGHEARTQRHLEVLDTLIAQGIDLATRLHQQSTTPSDLCNALAAPGIAVPFITPDVIAAFAQVNQTIRRAILVSRKLAEPLAPGRDARKSDAGDTREQAPRGPEPAQAELIRAEPGERVHSPDLEDRIGNRPIPEIIAGLCRDLAAESERLNHLTPEDARNPGARASQSIGPGALPAHPRQAPRPEPDADAADLVLERDGFAARPERHPPKPPEP